MPRKRFPRYWPFVMGIHRCPVIPLTKGRWRGRWCFLWCQPEQTVEKNIELLGVWDAMAFIVTSMLWTCSSVIQIMAWCRFVAQGIIVKWTLGKGSSEISINSETSSLNKIFWKCLLQNVVYFVEPQYVTLQWNHYERDGIWYHRRLNCLLNCLFRHRLKKTSKLRVTGLC